MGWVMWIKFMIEIKVDVERLKLDLVVKLKLNSGMIFWVCLKYFEEFFLC